MRVEEDNTLSLLRKCFGIRTLRKFKELTRDKFTGRLVLNYHLGRVPSFEIRIIEHEEPKR